MFSKKKKEPEVLFTKEDYEKYKNEKWFQPTISREQAIEILEKEGIGSFVIRQSSQPLSFALSYKTEEKIFHSVVAKKDMPLEQLVRKAKKLVAEKDSIEEQAVRMGFDRERVRTALTQDSNLTLIGLVDRLLLEGQEKSEEEIIKRQKKNLQRTLTLNNDVERVHVADVFDEQTEQQELSTKPIENDFKAEWFFGDISRQKAESILKKCNYDAFLIRNSSLEKCYSLSALKFQKNEMTHTIIHVNDNKKFQLFLKSEDYDTLSELVEKAPELRGFKPAPKESNSEAPPKLTRLVSNKGLSRSAVIESKAISLEHSRKLEATKSQMNIQVGPPANSRRLIMLKLYNTEYVPGEKIMGEVILNNPSPVQIQRVIIHIVSLAKSFNGVIAFPSGMDFSVEEIGSFQVTIWKDKSKKMLKEGTYVWNFEFKLPEKLKPSMFFKDLLYTFHQVRAWIVPSDTKKRDVKSMEKLNFISEPLLIDIYGMSDAEWGSVVAKATPIKTSKSFRNDKIQIEMKIPTNVFQFLSPIDINIQCSNMESKSFKITADLIQIITISAPNYQRTFKEAKIVSEKGKIEKSQPGQIFHFHLNIPANDDQGAASSETILPSVKESLYQIEHFVQLSIQEKKSWKLSLRHGHLQVRIPIRIFPISQWAEGSSSILY